MERGKEALAKLEAEGYKPSLEQLDVADDQSIQRFAETVKNKYGEIDTLINNAGIAYPHNSTESLATQARETCAINYFGTRNDIDAVVEGFVQDCEAGKTEGWPKTTYGLSKAALIALTAAWARMYDRNPDREVIVTCCCPEAAAEAAETGAATAETAAATAETATTAATTETSSAGAISAETEAASSSSSRSKAAVRRDSHGSGCYRIGIVIQINVERILLPGRRTNFSCSSSKSSSSSSRKQEQQREARAAAGRDAPSIPNATQRIPFILRNRS
ncbi:hypothetical protein ACSSS7_000369 [Eimeria intestinalis]